jgi:hypothetical protein
MFARQLLPTKLSGFNFKYINDESGIQKLLEARKSWASSIDVVNMWTLYEINPFISLC